MTKYVIAMKSGFSFVVEIKDFNRFVEDVVSHINPEAENNLQMDGGVVFNVNDISAIFPLSIQQSARENAPANDSSNLWRG